MEHFSVFLKCFTKNGRVSVCVYVPVCLSCLSVSLSVCVFVCVGVSTSGPSRYTDCTHVCVFVVAVGGQEHLGYFVHSTQEKGQLSLCEEENRTVRVWSTSRYQWKLVETGSTRLPWHCTYRTQNRPNPKGATTNVSVCLLYLHLSRHTSQGSLRSSPSASPERHRDR